MLMTPIFQKISQDACLVPTCRFQLKSLKIHRADKMMLRVRWSDAGNRQYRFGLKGLGLKTQGYMDWIGLNCNPGVPEYVSYFRISLHSILFFRLVHLLIGIMTFKSKISEITIWHDISAQTTKIWKHQTCVGSPCGNRLMRSQISFEIPR